MLSDLGDLYGKIEAFGSKTPLTTGGTENTEVALGIPNSRFPIRHTFRQIGTLAHRHPFAALRASIGTPAHLHIRTFAHSSPVSLTSFRALEQLLLYCGGKVKSFHTVAIEHK